MSRFFDSMKNLMFDRIFIITGAPGSGKTTYAQANRKPGDIIIDLDYLAAALMASTNPHDKRDDVLDAAFFLRSALLTAIKNNTVLYSRAFIIATNDAYKLRDELGGTVIDVDKGYKDTFDRIDNDNTTSEDDKKRRREYAIQYYSNRQRQKK